MTTKRTIVFTLTLAVVMVAALLLAGCSGLEPTTKPEGMFSCVDCHTDREQLRADLEADPLPEKVAAESEGEG